MKVLLTAEAEEELIATARYYASEASTALGLAFLDEADRAFRLLLEQPMIGAAWSGSMRRLAMRRFPFTLIHEVREDEIRVIGIAHQRRRPGYWTE